MILEIIVATIFIATVFNIVLNKFHMPTIIGYILTWTIISYGFWLHDYVGNHELKTIAEFGIVFLMFSIWLEFSLKHMIKMKKNVFLFWSLQFFVVSSVFYLIASYIFWLSSIESIIISVWLTLSSTAIVLKTLNENWDINKDYWNRSLGILIFQDLMVIPILLLITVFSTNDVSIWILLTETIISAIVLLLILWIFGRYLLDYFLYKVAQTKSNEIFIGSILFIIIWSSALAHFLGFSYSLWAFIAGMLIAETHYKHQVEADLIPFRDLLLWFFFVTVWMQLDLIIIKDNILIILGLLSILLFIKVSLMFLILERFNNKRSAFKTALSLFQFWEFGIVILELANMKNLLDPGMWQILIVVIILSMIITPVVLRNIWPITDLLFWYKHLDKNACIISTKLKKHIVLIWYWRLWKILSKFLDKQNVNYVILESYIKAYKQWKSDWKPIIFWNAFQANTLKSVNIEEAETVLISVWKSERLFLIANVIKKMNVKWNIIVKVNNFEEERMLNDLHIEDIIVETEKTALAMIEKVEHKKIASKKE